MNNKVQLSVVDGSHLRSKLTPLKIKVFLQHGMHDSVIWASSSVVLNVYSVGVSEIILQASFAGHGKTWMFPVHD